MKKSILYILFALFSLSAAVSLTAWYFFTFLLFYL